MREIWGFGDFGIRKYRNALRLRSIRFSNALRLRSQGTVPLHTGITLLEVLVTIFILSLGLLGVAALIPIGKFSMIETEKSDRTGTCGRAGLREVQVRRMLDYRSWSPQIQGSATPGVLIIDPLGYHSYGAALPFGGVFSRLTLSWITSLDIADQVFRWRDDLIFTLPSGGNRPIPPSAGASEGNYSWFFTICPTPSDVSGGVPLALRRAYTVSVAVCHKRILTADHEHTAGVNFLGAGTIQYDADLGDIKSDNWVMLVGLSSSGSPVAAHWYRIVGMDKNNRYLTLLGPDWNTTAFPAANTRLVAVEGVSGVYTAVMEVDTSSVWTK